jgi:hypothetical protein
MINLDNIKPDPIVTSSESAPIETVTNTVSADPLISSTGRNPMEQELQEWKDRCSVMAAERELAMALSGESIRPGAASQLMKLWSDRIISKIDEKSSIKVQSDDGRNLADAVKDWLQSPDFAHFRTASHKGGTAARTESGVTERTVPATLQAKNLNESVIQHWRQRALKSDQSLQRGLWPRY